MSKISADMLVNKLLLDLRFPLISEGKEALLQARTTFGKKILPELEKLPDPAPDRLIRINHLEIDLGEVTLGEIAGKVAGLLETAINQAAGASLSLAEDDRFSFVPAGSYDEQQAEALFKYLVSGYSGWQFRSGVTSTPAGWLMAVCGRDDPKQVSRLYQMLAGNELPVWDRKQAFLRFIGLLTAGSKMDFLVKFTERSPAKVKDLIGNVITRLRSPGLLVSPGGREHDELLGILLYQVVFGMDEKPAAGRSNRLSRADALLSAITMPGQGIPSGVKENNKRKNSSAGKASPARGLRHFTVVKTDIKNEIIQLSPDNDFQGQYSETERILIGNAGLVLLAPFLTRFFENTGLVKKGEFLSNRHRNRAVFLLHRITVPAGRFTEDPLVLNKLLCGLPLSAAIDLRQKLKSREKQEILELLESVVANWTVLKNTSPGGLRDAFLDRKGTVEKNGEDYLVRVEVLPHDLLVSFIPWNFTVIKYPWNKYLIHTEWTMP